MSSLNENIIFVALCRYLVFCQRHTLPTNDSFVTYSLLMQQQKHLHILRRLLLFSWPILATRLGKVTDCRRITFHRVSQTEHRNWTWCWTPSNLNNWTQS